MKIKSRKLAKIDGLSTYFTGKSCKNGHICDRYCSNGGCTECLKARTSIWQKENKIKVRVKSYNWKNSNREAAKQIRINYRKKNPEKLVSAVQKRRALKKQAIPSWFSDFDKFVIEEANLACKRRELLIGVKHEVDHLIPLSRGGKHCANNLQVIPKSLNAMKGNRLILTKPGEWVTLIGVRSAYDSMVG